MQFVAALPADADQVVVAVGAAVLDRHDVMDDRARPLVAAAADGIAAEDAGTQARPTPAITVGWARAPASLLSQVTAAAPTPNG